MNRKSFLSNLLTLGAASVVPISLLANKEEKKINSFLDITGYLYDLPSNCTIYSFSNPSFTHVERLIEVTEGDKVIRIHYQFDGYKGNTIPTLIQYRVECGSIVNDTYKYLHIGECLRAQWSDKQCLKQIHEMLVKKYL